ncbi:hypothetical protein EV361DRAFT_999082 [Lentinula raphanica]|nr:hypothetical protein EV361DRAFT_999082 [Lentinula raphanica]
MGLLQKILPIIQHILGENVISCPDYGGNMLNNPYSLENHFEEPHGFHEDYLENIQNVPRIFLIDCPADYSGILLNILLIIICGKLYIFSAYSHTFPDKNIGSSPQCQAQACQQCVSRVGSGASEADPTRNPADTRTREPGYGYPTTPGHGFQVVGFCRVSVGFNTGEVRLAQQPAEPGLWRGWASAGRYCNRGSERFIVFKFLNVQIISCTGKKKPHQLFVGEQISTRPITKAHECLDRVRAKSVPEVRDKNAAPRKGSFNPDRGH